MMHALSTMFFIAAGLLAIWAIISIFSERI